MKYLLVPGSGLSQKTRRPRVTLRDRDVVLLAVLCAAGASVPVPVGLPIGILGLALATLARKTVPWILAAACVVSGLSARAITGMAIGPGVYRGVVEVMRVTTWTNGDVHVEVRARAHHLDVVPLGQARTRMAQADPGTKFMVSARVQPLPARDQFKRGSHIAGRMHVDEVQPGPRPRLFWRTASTVREAIRALGSPLNVGQQALFNGFVLGDPAGQSEVQQADFRASGLTHLLVASGENVAFVLTLAGFLLSRLSLRIRMFAVLVVLGMYGLVTGLEPSVLRAATMAGIAAWSAGVGQPIKSWRPLAFAVFVLLLVDPFLVNSLSFRLSVGASIGIIGLSRPILTHFGGTYAWRMPLAVTIAAQIGVAPMLLGFPGGMPVASLPANLLAAIPAGLVMVVGLPALAIAATGLPGSGLAVWIPRGLLGWIDGVARFTAGLHLGYLGPAAVAIAVSALAITIAASTHQRARVSQVACLVACCALLSPIIAAPHASDVIASNGLVIVRRGSGVVLVITGRVSPTDMFRTLSIHRINAAQVIVVPHGDRIDESTIANAAKRISIGAVLSPRPMKAGEIPLYIAREGADYEIGKVTIEVVAIDSELSVHVE